MMIHYLRRFRRIAFLDRRLPVNAVTNVGRTYDIIASSATTDDDIYTARDYYDGLIIWEYCQCLY